MILLWGRGVPIRVCIPSLDFPPLSIIIVVSDGGTNHFPKMTKSARLIETLLKLMMERVENVTRRQLFLGGKVGTVFH